MGSIKSTLANRDEATGGLAYYIENGTGNRVKWEHGRPAPGGETVYGDGMILPGVKLVNGQSVENDIVASSTTYYKAFLDDMSSSFQRDALYKNDYIKLREIALSYTLPKKWVEKVRMEKVTLQLIGRNLFYLYKTLPNVDAESAQGTSGQAAFHEQSFLPSIRTLGFGINLSF